jgi:hypothetical protein
MFKSLLLTLTFVLGAHAGIVLNPVTVTGLPGQTVGWGFTMTSDPLYYLTVSTALVDTESNPTLGFFSDFISLSGGPALGVLAPGAPDWVQSYDAMALSGFGEYWIDPNALPGDSNYGQFLVILLRYSADPNTCGLCFVDSQFQQVDFGVNVAAPTPEPGTLVPAGLVAGLLVWVRRRRYLASGRCSASHARTNVQRR